jgi:hypothetical protein
VSETTVCVRMKPHNPRAGHVLQHFAYRGIVFRAGSGWSKVLPEVAEHLKRVRQRAHDVHSPLAFDVCSEEEARRLDALDAEQSAEVTPVERARVQVARDEGGAGASAPAANAGSSDPTRDRPSARAKQH